MNESAENYLERILMLKEQKGIVRSIDIARAMDFSKPSVSVAMKLLRENGYITMDSENLIELTPAGLAIAKGIYERHKVLTAMLVGLGVNEKTAREDACRIEHDISEQSFESIKAHMVEKGTLKL
ncbi:MAG: metal-dependent transcriptional regulator [Clostridiales bacterium]|nr:metal-dependent transcriptional regulator [Clostridiales bacterium]